MAAVIYMTVDPRIPTNAEMEHVGFSPTTQTLPGPNAKCREVFGELYGRSAASYYCSIDQGLLGKIPSGNFPKDFTGNGFFPVPVQISFP